MNGRSRGSSGSTRHIDERDGPVRAAARRERQRLNADLGDALQARRHRNRSGQHHHHRRRLHHADRDVRLPRRGRPCHRHRRFARLQPVGRNARGRARRPTCPTARWSQRFDSYLYRPAAPCPPRRRREIDAISAASAVAPANARTRGDLDPDAQDARRLMSIHLPGLMDRYCMCPLPSAPSRTAKARRSTSASSKASPPAAPRSAKFRETARADVAAFETQGRFIKSRYGENADSPTRPSRRGRTATERLDELIDCAVLAAAHAPETICIDRSLTRREWRRDFGGHCSGPRLSRRGSPNASRPQAAVALRLRIVLVRLLRARRRRPVVGTYYRLTTPARTAS